MSLFRELKRRNVFRVSGVYAIVGWLLLQVAGSLEAAMALPDWFDSLVLAVLLLGFPLAAIFAWAFELTPEGMKRTADVDPQESIASKTGSRLDMLLVVALLVFAAAIIAPRFFPDKETLAHNDASLADSEADDAQAESAIEPSIAVLAFEDMSPEGTEEYFADGVAEEILNLLAKIDGLKVAARTSSFAFKGERANIGEIGKQLQVAHVLEGSVRRAGNSIRVTAQLINAESGFHLWSETYDRELTNIFAIQDDIAANILAALQSQIFGLEVRMPSEKRHQAQSVAAYEEFLKGKELISQMTEEDILAGITRFEAAMAIEPGFALPYAYTAYALLLSEQLDQSRQLGTNSIDEKVEPLLQRSVELAPDNAEVMAIQGRFLYRQYQYDEALASLNKALESNPNFALAYEWRANVFERDGKFDAMLRDLEMAYHLDPLSVTTAQSLVYAYRNFQRYGDADRITEALLAIFPDNVQLHQMRMTTKFVAGRYGELARLAEKTIEQFPADEDIRNWLNWSYVQLGLPDKVIDAIPQHQRLIVRAAGDHEAERAFLDEHGPWLDAEMHYAFAHGDEDDLVVAVDEYVSQLEEKNYPWRTECDTVHAIFMQKAGRKEAFESILAQCATEYEPALKSGYLCYCSWIRVINYLILSGREEEAVRKLFEWFDKGGSDITFEAEEVIAQLRGRPEYQQFLERNAENIAVKRARYLQAVELATTGN